MRPGWGWGSEADNHDRQPEEVYRPVSHFSEMHNIGYRHGNHLVLPEPDTVRFDLLEYHQKPKGQMTTLTDQLTHVQWQLRHYKERFDNLASSYDQPRSEIEKANQLYLKQLAVCETVKRCLDCENASLERAKEWKEEKP